jgi:MraZ protein
VFFTHSTNSVDAKGRIILPQAFRDKLGEVFYLANGFEDCIQVFTTETFEKRVKKITASLPAKKAYAVIRSLEAEEVKLNAQGRVTISANLRSKHNIKDEAVVLGMGDFIEIWDKTTYDKNQSDNKEDSDSALLSLSFEIE